MTLKGKDRYLSVFFCASRICIMYTSVLCHAGDRHSGSMVASMKSVSIRFVTSFNLIFLRR
jgi:hypothetical protein